MLITWHAPLLDEVVAALERQLPALPRGDLGESLENFGALILGGMSPKHWLGRTKSRRSTSI